MTSRRRPEVRIQHGVHDRAVTAGALAEGTALAWAAAAEFVLDARHGFAAEKIRTASVARGIDVLIAAQLGEAVGKTDRTWLHRAGGDQTVGLRRNVLTEVAPMRMRGPSCGESDKIDEQRKP